MHPDHALGEFSPDFMLVSCMLCTRTNALSARLAQQCRSLWMSLLLAQGKDANMQGTGRWERKGYRGGDARLCLGPIDLCQVCNMLLALLTELIPLGKTLLSHVCSLPCCCSNLHPGAQACPIPGVGWGGVGCDAQASYFAGRHLATSNV